LFGALAACVVAAATMIGCGSSNDNRPAEWSYIYATIIQPSCATASCHSAIAARAGVVLEGRETAFQTLTGRHFVIQSPDKNLADQSELLFLLNPTAVRRMPPDFPMPPADVDLIRAWIEAGALDN
jgi:hypothetical protein